MNERERTNQQDQLPPQMALMQLAMGYYVSRAIQVAATLGIADRIADGTQTASALAAATGTHAASLRRVLRLLVSVGVFAEAEDGGFTLTSLGDCLRSSVAGSVHAGALLLTGMTQDAWKELLYSVETGQPALPRVFGMDGFAYMAEHPEIAANFDRAMADFTTMVAFAVAAAYDFSAFTSVVDVGGGNGTLLAGLLRATPGLRGVVFDQPHVAERATQHLAELGLSARCDVVGGDFFREVPPGHDAYLLKHVIHDWDDARAVAILRTCRAAMGPRSRLLIIEGIYPLRVENTLASRSAASNDVNMLVCTGGRQRTEEELRALYAQARLRMERIVPTAANASVIEGMPA